MKRSPIIGGGVVLSLLLSTARAGENPAQGVTTTGQELEVTIDAPPVVEEQIEVLVDATATLGSAEKLTINVIYVVDVSGSMENEGFNPFQDINPPPGIGPEDDGNGDGVEGSTLDSAIFGLIALNESLENPANVRIGIVAFGDGGVTADMDPAGGQQNFLSPPQVDNSGNAVPDAEDVTRSLDTEFGGNGAAGVGLFTDKIMDGFAFATNYDAALSEMNAAFASNPADANIAFFMSDGTPTDFTTGAGSPLQEAIDEGYVVNTFGLGAIAPGLCEPGGPLDVIASSTGGTCTEVENPADLTTVLPGATSTELMELCLCVNGEEVACVVGPDEEMLSLFDVDIAPFLDPGDNLVEAKATAADGTLVTACTNVETAVCLLIIGLDPTNKILRDGDVLLVEPKSREIGRWLRPVTMESLPSIPVPDRPALVGKHVYFQVFMDNRFAFPEDPIQLSNGLDVTIGGDMPESYGDPTTIDLWAEAPAPLGGTIDLAFLIQGL